MSKIDSHFGINLFHFTKYDVILPIINLIFSKLDFYIYPKHLLVASKWTPLP